jgi:hypothetical protein
MASPAAAGGTSLTDKDLDTVRRIRGVDVAIPIYAKTMAVVRKDETRQLPLMGVNSREAKDFFEDMQSF